MMGYSLAIQAFHVVVWAILLAGSVVLLRRGYASAAVSMLLGAAITLLTGLLNLLMTIPMVFTSSAGVYPAKIMIMGGLVSAVGMFLFALGFWQLARTTKREG